jgi:cold-inducible RNA-binding protein
MGNKLYIGNLSYSIKDQDLHDLFSRYGEVISAKVITDRESGRSKGFGFVEMVSDDEAQRAISELDGHEVQGRQLKVNEARPRENTRPMGMGGGDRGGDRGPRGRFGGGGGHRRNDD